MPATDPTPDDLLIGAQLLLAEEAYLFGEGPISLEVTSIGEPYDYGGFEWVELDGFQLLGGGKEPRTVSVRVAALRQAADKVAKRAAR